jgi:hypothetical protein
MWWFSCGGSRVVATAMVTAMALVLVLVLVLFLLSLLLLLLLLPPSSLSVHAASSGMDTRHTVCSWWCLELPAGRDEFGFVGSGPPAAE